MKQMRFGILGKVIIALVFLSFICACAAFVNTPPAKAKRWEGTTLVYKDAVWKLDIKYLNKGKKSEGQDGVLYKSGKLVRAKKIDEVLDTPLGTLKYYGKRTSVSKPEAVTGWNFAGGAINSWDIKLK